MIDTATSAVTATIAVGTSPYSAAVSPDGTRADITNASDDTVSVVTLGRVSTQPEGEEAPGYAKYAVLSWRLHPAEASALGATCDGAAFKPMVDAQFTDVVRPFTPALDHTPALFDLT